jgi:hypothetical protein
MVYSSRAKRIQLVKAAITGNKPDANKDEPKVWYLYRSSRWQVSEQYE